MMQLASVGDLFEELSEEQNGVSDERRAVERKPFVRPVKIVTNRDRDETHHGCSKDITGQGIGILTQSALQPNTIATLSIHSLKGRDVSVKAELRWSQGFGEGWFLTGWRFLS